MSHFLQKSSPAEFKADSEVLAKVLDTTDAGNDLIFLLLLVQETADLYRALFFFWSS